MEYFLGILVSLLVQGIKNFTNASEYVTLCIVAVISLAAAAVYTYLVQAGLWESFAQILMTSGAFYTFIIQRFTSGPVSSGGFPSSK